MQFIVIPVDLSIPLPLACVEREMVSIRELDSWNKKPLIIRA